MPVFGKCGMIRDFLIQIQASEPTKGQIHPYFFQQATLARNPVQITHQEQSQQYFGIDRGTASRAIGILQPLAHETQIHMTINLAQQVVLGDLVLQTKVVEQRSGARLLTHHFGVPPESYLAHSNSSHQKKEPFVPSFSTVSDVFVTFDGHGEAGRLSGLVERDLISRELAEAARPLAGDQPEASTA